jgi:hypothetical protein
VRRESLEKLWDAWERLKTLEPGKDKKASTTALLDKVSSEPMFRAYLEHEATRLTEIGNTFMIRHTESVLQNGDKPGGVKEWVRTRGCGTPRFNMELANLLGVESRR